MGDSGSHKKGETLKLPRPRTRPPPPPSAEVEELARTRQIAPPSQRWEPPDSKAGAEPAPTVRLPLSGAPEPTAADGKTREIELVVVHEHQLPAGERRPWRAVEIWTRRRVYGLDSTFRCVEILERATGKPEKGHEMLGARLGGGRLREPNGVRFSYPLPLPGMEAMFTRDKKHGYTSAVERVIMRVRVLHTSADETQPTWEEIASRWSDPPPRMP